MEWLGTSLGYLTNTMLIAFFFKEIIRLKFVNLTAQFIVD